LIFTSRANFEYLERTSKLTLGYQARLSCDSDAKPFLVVSSRAEARISRQAAAVETGITMDCMRSAAAVVALIVDLIQRDA